MGYPTKVQRIKRVNSEQFYINFPMPLAQSLEFEAGEEVEWIITEEGHLLLLRPNASNRTSLKKNRRKSKPSIN